MLNKEKHRTILFQILKDVFESDLAHHLAFKWGTACYFLHGLDRFSTDLDFDLIDDHPVDRDMERLLRKYGELKKWRHIVLSYGTTDMNIKIDINRSVWKANKYEIVHFYGTDIRVQDRATIFANKLVALTERTANRDLYDVWFFFRNGFPISDGVIFERTGKHTKDFLRDLKIELEKYGERYNILDGLGEVLSEKQKFFVKEKLLTELRWYVLFRIDFWDAR